MSIPGEIARLYWRLRSYTDFVKPEVAIFGPFATKNLGDDSALLACEHYFDHKLKVLTAQTYRRIPENLKFLITGVGGCFNEATPSHLIKYLDRIPSRKFPTIMLSGGINRDYVHKDYEKNYPLFKTLASKLDFITTRDDRTKRMLESLGIQNVKTTPDFVLSLPGNTEINPETQKEKRNIGLVLATHSDTLRDRAEEMYSFLIRLTNELINLDYQVTCVSFQTDERSEGDHAINEVYSAQALKGQVKHPEKVEVLHRMLSPKDTLKYFQDNLSHVISMRLHGNIMAARAGIPFISLSYNDKHLGFLEMIKMESFDVPFIEDALHTTPITNLMEKIETEYPSLCEKIRTRRNELSEITINHVNEIRETYNL